MFNYEMAVAADDRFDRMQHAMHTILTRCRPEGQQQPAAFPQFASTANANATANASATSHGSQREEVPLGEYQSQSESASESKEIDPMDELSDFEHLRPSVPSSSMASASSRAMPSATLSVPAHHNDNDNDDNDDDDHEMEDAQAMEQAMEQADQEEEDDDVDDDDDTACVICKKNDHVNRILLCDHCDGEFHTYCLSPPLQLIPEGDWFCPNCVRHGKTFKVSSDDNPIQSATTATSAAAAATTATSAATAVVMPPTRLVVKQEPAVTASASPPMERPASLLTPIATPTPTSTIASTATTTTATATTTASATTTTSEHEHVSAALSLAANPERSNQLLIHASYCEAIHCDHADFGQLCAHMKRFLRGVCWASHNTKWRSFAVARVTAELFAYHSIHCQEANHCQVPMCDHLRHEECV